MTKYQKKTLVVFVGLLLMLGFSAVSFNFVTQEMKTSSPSAIGRVVQGTDKATVVVFKRHGCPDCRSVQTLVKMGAFSQKTVFVEATSKDDQQYFKRFGVRHTPTFMILKQGQPQILWRDHGRPVRMYSGTDRKKIKKIFGIRPTVIAAGWLHV
ncbi:thioredoxin family protein [Furfurilactobacillus rossiae]|uniref:Thioredoxin domain-containing protein n=1 Tax=Furfurilactobacillus rossiae DSM 15814 TaxID=1114972 RepID=A0A0R1RA08_9LACO|nr:thioredoxin family protein [Furfurilactobacillus rossiae]KRL53997.1 hypothetical protein FD35_GL000700 [Furfurilactobacillus rossiae DSM 15814]QFR68252.1 hypothetical protein LR814_13905 [Furfurilactobacillus rossiae]QLE62688.1 thioredoxin-like protein [Furfurilactobacillus rossiae]HAT54107.1 thioredoxin [Lactobacillus sp.]